MNIRKSFIRVSIAIICIDVLAYIFQVLRNATLAQYNSVEFLGLIGVLTAYSGILSTLLCLGRPPIVLRNVAKNRSSTEDHVRWLGEALFQSLLLLSVVMFLTIVVMKQLGFHLSSTVWAIFPLAAISITTSLVGSTLEGRGFVVANRLASGLSKPVFVILAALLLSGFPAETWLFGYLSAQLALLLVLLGVACWLGVRPVRIRAFDWDWIRPKLELENAYVLLISGFNILILTADVLVLHQFEALGVVGGYTLIVGLLGIIGLGMGAANSVFLPNYSKLLSEKNWPAARKQFFETQVLSTSWSVLAVFALCLLTVTLGTLLGVPQVIAAPWIIVFLLGFGDVVNAMTGPNTNSLFAEGKARFVAWSLGFAAVGNVLGNALLVPALGPYGAALSTCISVSAVHIVQYMYARRTSALFNEVWDGNGSSIPTS